MNITFADFLVTIDSIPESTLKEIMGDEYIDTPGSFLSEAEAAGINTDEDVFEWFAANMGRETFNDLEKWFDGNENKVKQIFDENN